MSKRLEKKLSSKKLTSDNSAPNVSKVLPLSGLFPDFVKELKCYWIEQKFEWKPRKVQGDLVPEWIDDFAELRFLILKGLSGYFG